MTSEIIQKIRALLSEKDLVLVAIDGRCASGKTTLARTLLSHFDANLFHMDDFFLRPEQRTESRLSEAGGNVDRERLLAEVLLPLETGRAFSYRPYDCGSQSLGASIAVSPKRLNIVEGSYSCHPLLFDRYDLHVFMTVKEDEQLRRIRLRDGETKAEIFRTRWIPMEERYFSAFDIQDRCDLIISCENTEKR